jgi:streptogramin lyase
MGVLHRIKSTVKNRYYNHGIFMKNLLANRKTLIVITFAVVGAFLAPNGFFTGHRTVILEAELTVNKPEVHLSPDAELQSAMLTGVVVTATGMPISGAMITAFNSEKTRRITVYSHPDGRYQLPVTFAGDLSFRVRTPYFKDLTKEVAVADGESVTVDFATPRLTMPTDLSESLTASAHIAQMQWPSSKDRSSFISQCNFCHQIGNSLTRRPRTKEEWRQVVDRMEGYLVFVTDDEKASFVDRLDETFTGEPVKAVQTWDVSAALSRARIEEWVAGDGLSFIHDADVGYDGRLYGADEGHDIIWVLDRKTGQVDKVKLPAVDLPVGGKFSGLALPIGVFTGNHGPHSMAEGNDGRLWITNSLSSRLMAYSADISTFETYDIAADSLYLHTIRKDLKGRLWFTVAASNQVGRFDPQTNQLDLLDLPVSGLSQWLTDAFMPTLTAVGAWFPRKNLPIILSHHKWAGLGRKVMAMPYGIDVNPTDGSIWYVKLYANKIGRIDPETFEIREIDTPAAGPRRPRFAPDGIMWIPAFDIGALLRFDPKTEKFKTYPLPTLAPGEYETPYAINVHPQTGLVWITSNMSDRIFSFDPKTEEFTSYPLPMRVNYLRDLVFTQDGKICSSNSNLPAYGIEGGLGGFICLDPG